MKNIADSKRLKKTTAISTEIWQMYKVKYQELGRYARMTDLEQRKWWENTVAEFNDYFEKYTGTTHEAYVKGYCIACMNDLRAITR